MRNSGLGLSVIVALALGGLPAAQAVTLSVVPQQTVIQAGGVGIVDVVASGLTDAAVGGAIGAYDINVTFDPAILAYSTTSFGSELDVTGVSEFRGASLSGPGKLETFEVSADSAQDLAALQPNNFVLFSLSFTGLSQGASALGLNVLSLSDESGHPLGADLQSSSLTVAPVPLPAAGWLLLSGLCGVFGARRYREK